MNVSAKSNGYAARVPSSVSRARTARSALETTRQEQAGDSLKLTIDVKEQQYAQKALQWGMRAIGLKRGVVIVMNPQTGEILAAPLPVVDRLDEVAGIGRH